MRLQACHSHLLVIPPFVVVLLALLMRLWKALRDGPDVILFIVIGACHRLSPIGSFKCGFCNIQFLPARNPIRRAPDIVDRGLDRDMQRSHSRDAEPKCGHTRSASGDEHKRMVKLQKHTHRWDTDAEYRLQRSDLEWFAPSTTRTSLLRGWRLMPMTLHPIFLNFPWGSQQPPKSTPSFWGPVRQFVGYLLHQT